MARAARMSRATKPPRAAGASGSPQIRGLRAQQSAQRKEAILAAALEEFSARGFAAARLDDVARRAGVAKGTIYLHFRDKEMLFQELVRFQIGPVVGALETVLASDLPQAVTVEHAPDIFPREICGSHRTQLLL